MAGKKMATCSRGHKDWRSNGAGERRCGTCYQQTRPNGKSRGMVSRAVLIEQGIARGERLERIAAAVGVPVAQVYRVADRMDEAHRELVAL